LVDETLWRGVHFLLTMSLSTEQFQVAGPRHPIVAVLGEDAILPCFLVPAMNAENMELGWFRTTFSQTVFIYWNQWEQTEEQMAEYRGRTSLVRSCLTEGHAAMHLRQVRVSDNGMYTCFFRHGSFYEEADLEVKVAGMGSAPQVHIEGPEEDGVRVVCKASGWFPKPQVQWRDFSGNKFPALSEAHTQDSEQLFSVEATLVVRDSSVGDVTCSVLNPVLDQEKAVAIYIPEKLSFLPTMSLSTEQFQIVGPRHPIVAVLGEDAILPCALFPAMNAENMELGWFRTTVSQAVFIYWNQQEQSEEQMAEYRGRTSLVKEFLSEGQASVHIHKVQVSDNGMYTCFFRHGGIYEEADLELKVAGMGSAPQVHIEGPEEDGVCVVCKASGWFPKPQVQWRDLSGNKFPALSEAHTQDTEELFSVEATLVVRDSSVGNVTCSVLNPVLGQEKAMAIYIPGQCCSHSQQSCGEGLASLSVLALLGVPLTCCLPGPQSPSSSGFSLEASICCGPDHAGAPTLGGLLFCHQSEKNIPEECR
uniref:Ig-like domain-containing protein n=1 Tax=Spermophilus dauricus TaxID=99837 RepID=A0A8C9P0K1_SPEDA